MSKQVGASGTVVNYVANAKDTVVVDDNVVEMAVKTDDDGQKKFCKKITKFFLLF